MRRVKSCAMRGGGDAQRKMFKAEARWLREQVLSFAPEAVSPLLNIGSSTKHFREVEQPWNEAELFAPLRARGIRVIHSDFREGEGIDIRADILSDADLPRLKALNAKAILCCNILEHVHEPKKLAQRCLDIVGSGGLVFVTVPYSYPHHRDPIDTMYRPSPAELGSLFADARLLDGMILGAGISYRDAVCERPWLLLRHFCRFPVPFLSFERWKRSMARLYWLAAEYRITCAVFEKP
jgi:SAM-dependent methyltransferase